MRRVRRRERITRARSRTLGMDGEIFAMGEGRRIWNPMYIGDGVIKTGGPDGWGDWRDPAARAVVAIFVISAGCVGQGEVEIL